MSEKHHFRITALVVGSLAVLTGVAAPSASAAVALVVPVPEPSSWLLLVIGLLALSVVFVIRGRKASQK